MTTSHPTSKKALFPLGQIVSTPGALDALTTTGTSAHTYLTRHSSGDWGDLPDADRQENEISLKRGYRVFSAYLLPITRVKLWIITEADRSVTTLLLPNEY